MFPPRTRLDSFPGLLSSYYPLITSPRNCYHHHNEIARIRRYGVLFMPQAVLPFCLKCAQSDYHFARLFYFFYVFNLHYLRKNTASSNFLIYSTRPLPASVIIGISLYLLVTAKYPSVLLLVSE